MEEQIVCPYCGSKEYTTEFKHSQQTAWCKGCGGFIKNIPYKPAAFYFGKYKGTPVSECNDVGYMEWFLETAKPKPTMKNALKKRISVLTLTSEDSAPIKLKYDSDGAINIEGHRNQRLLQLLIKANELSSNIANSIRYVSDHEGILSVYWSVDPDMNDMGVLDKAWEECYEYSVEHYDTQGNLIERI